MLYWPYLRQNAANGSRWSSCCCCCNWFDLKRPRRKRNYILALIELKWAKMSVGWKLKLKLLGWFVLYSAFSARWNAWIQGTKLHWRISCSHRFSSSLTTLSKVGEKPSVSKSHHGKFSWQVTGPGSKIGFCLFRNISFKIHETTDTSVSLRVAFHCV